MQFRVVLGEERMMTLYTSIVATLAHEPSSGSPNLNERNDLMPPKETTMAQVNNNNLIC